MLLSVVTFGFGAIQDTRKETAELLATTEMLRTTIQIRMQLAYFKQMALQKGSHKSRIGFEERKAEATAILKEFTYGSAQNYVYPEYQSASIVSLGFQAVALGPTTTNYMAMPGWMTTVEMSYDHENLDELLAEIQDHIMSSKL